MREIPAALAAHLDGTATTLCRAWRVTRRDGTVLGFTEHDHDLSFAGTTFRAASGFAGSDIEAGSGLAADAAEVAGGFSDEAITEVDLVAGRYDGARVEAFLVNWADPAQHLLLRVQEIGEVSRGGGRFSAELRRLTHRLDQVNGRLYGRRCDAGFGDQRCGIDATVAPYRETGTVTGVAGETQILVGGLAATSGHYSDGRLEFTSGVNAGLVADIERHTLEGGSAVILLWQAPPLVVSIGDTVQVTAGCDKRFSTCRTRFANGLNFRGFPHMPGSDFALGYADGDTVHDGRPLYD